MNIINADLDDEMARYIHGGRAVSADVNRLGQLGVEMPACIRGGRPDVLDTAMTESSEKRTEAMNLELERFEMELTSRPLTGTLATKIEGRENSEEASDNNLRKKEDKDTEPLEIYEKALKFLSLFGLSIGIRFRFDWIYRKYVMFWVTCFVLLFTLFSIFYTMYIHYTNGNYVRILEPAAISGMTISVNKIFIA